MTNESKLPVWLRRTPAQQAADKALQAQMRQVYGRVHLSPTEKHLMRADMTERSARAQLEHLSSLDDPSEHQLNAAKGQLAEAWAMKGMYREAAELHPSQLHAERLLAIAEAIEQDDDETCACQPEKVMNPSTQRTTVLHNENVDEIVYSSKHGRLMPLIRCRCGLLNVKHAPAELQRRIEGIKAREVQV